MGVHAQAGNIFGAGEGQLEKVNIAAVLQSLTQQRQPLKYLPLSDERFCGVSQHSI